MALSIYYAAATRCVATLGVLAAVGCPKSPSGTANRDSASGSQSGTARPGAARASSDVALGGADGAPTADAKGNEVSASVLGSMIANANDKRLLLAIRGDSHLVAVDAAGNVAREILIGSFARAHYDSVTSIIWFIRDHRLVAVDLTRPELEEVTVIDDMPDLGYVVSRDARLSAEFCPPACISVRVAKIPEIAVAIGDDGSGSRAEANKVIKTAEKATPRLTAQGSRFLAELFARRQGLAPKPLALFTPESLPMDGRTSSTKGSKSCTSSCGKQFDVPSLSAALVVSGRACDCRLDRCWPTCIWLDHGSGAYSSVSAPQDKHRGTVAEGSCHPEFDVTGTAYILAPLPSDLPRTSSRICLFDQGCRTEGGAVLGWLQSGFTTEEIPEDESNCPE